jgi:hypothetical protein
MKNKSEKLRRCRGLSKDGILHQVASITPGPFLTHTQATRNLEELALTGLSKNGKSGFHYSKHTC